MDHHVHGCYDCALGLVPHHVQELVDLVASHSSASSRYSPDHTPPVSDRMSHAARSCSTRPSVRRLLAVGRFASGLRLPRSPPDALGQTRRTSRALPQLSRLLLATILSAGAPLRASPNGLAKSRGHCGFVVSFPLHVAPASLLRNPATFPAYLPHKVVRLLAPIALPPADVRLRLLRLHVSVTVLLGS